jgi:pimeloyl-ACP methyl ester carboxylesterase
MLYVERSGEGAPVVLLHGLTATHRYVVMGSKSLQRAGHDVVAYDARGHGASDPAPTSEAYTYADLAGDLLQVMDEAGFERAVLAGASMGAHTAVRVALEHPERVAGLVIVTPAYDPEDWPGNLERWDALSEGLRRGGVDGFVEAYGDEGPEKWKDTLRTVLRQRLGAHEHPEAVADALRAVPRSRPFAAREELTRIAAPTVVVADRDEPDPGHPLAVGELYASLIPGARLVVEDEGSSPIAWQGGQLSKVIASVVEEAGLSA